MIYANHWTGHNVRERLIEAFHLLPATPVYSPTPDRLEAAIGNTPIDGILLIMATGRYLGQRSEERRCLLTYARARSRGLPVVALCREEGWSRATFYRCVARASETVAQGLNRDRGPRAVAA